MKFSTVSFTALVFTRFDQSSYFNLQPLKYNAGMLTMDSIMYIKHSERIYTTHNKQIAKPIQHNTRKYQLQNLGKYIFFCQRIPKFTLSLDSLSRAIKAHFTCTLDTAHWRTQNWEFMLMNKMTYWDKKNT